MTTDTTTARPAPTTPDLTSIARRVLSVQRNHAKPLPAGTTSIDLLVPAGRHWPDGEVVRTKLHRRGHGPAALLVHGWQSQAADLGALCDALLAAGFSVWMPDLPAHGHAEGRHLSIPLAAATLKAAQSHTGPLALAVAHSFGGASLVQALHQGLDAARVVLLAAPTHYGTFARRAALQAGLPAPLVKPLMGQLAELIGVHPDDIDMVAQARGLTQPALLVHSSDDPIVPQAGLRDVAGAWRGAQWLPLEGLGHFKVLSDAGVLQRIQDFAMTNAPHP